MGENYSLLIMGVSSGDEDGDGVDGDCSGGNSPSRRRAGTETSVPRNLSSMAAALRNSFWSMTWCFRVYASGGINRRRGDVGGPPRGSNHLAARPGAQPREHVVWRPWASPWLALLAPCVPRKNRRFGFCFVEFREYCPNSFSGTKNCRKQELALWHLVNRLVPENA